MKPKQNCGNCMYSADWWLTPTGRFKAGLSAKCTYKVTMPVLPRSVVLYESRIAVLPRDGTTCPVWEAKP